MNKSIAFPDVAMPAISQMASPKLLLSNWLRGRGMTYQRSIDFLTTKNMNEYEDLDE